MPPNCSLLMSVTTFGWMYEIREFHWFLGNQGEDPEAGKNVLVSRVVMN